MKQLSPENFPYHYAVDDLYDGGVSADNIGPHGPWLTDVTKVYVIISGWGTLYLREDKRSGLHYWQHGSNARIKSTKFAMDPLILAVNAAKKLIEG